MPIAIQNVYFYTAYLAKQVHRHPDKQIKLSLLTYLEAAERAFIGGYYKTMMLCCAQISATLSHS